MKTGREHDEHTADTASGEKGHSGHHGHCCHGHHTHEAKGGHHHCCCQSGHHHHGYHHEHCHDDHGHHGHHDHCHKHHHHGHHHGQGCCGAGLRGDAPGLCALGALDRGQRAMVRRVCAHGELGRRLRDMGLLPGVYITMGGRAPLGDPLAVSLDGYDLSLRGSEAAQVLVEPLSADDAADARSDA